MSIDLSNPLEWNLVYGGSPVANPDLSLRSVNFVTTGYQLIVGVRVTDKPTWRFGGYLTQQIAALPSSSAELFTALVRIKQYPLTCQQYQAIELDQAIPLPSICRIEFPKYFRQCDVQVYARNDI
jgi:hypothetical protein